MHVARVYLRVSTQGQDLDRQESIIAEARDARARRIYEAATQVRR
jgi:DNA invertase Pin-like site-specific DNA recombinase